MHQQLARTFGGLTNEREKSSPVYFSEHGLTGGEIDSIYRTLVQASQSYSLAELLAENTHLILLVAAVEVGYSYEGNGTDFWPSLEQTIGFWFDFEERQQLTGCFRKASQRFNGAIPGNSDWDNAFCHITWPITHSVAPKDIRRPFAESLRRFRGSIEQDDTSLIQELTRFTPLSWSRRYRTWLQNERLVAAIVRDLFDGPTAAQAGVLSDGFRERLIRDLREEPEIALAIRVAARNRRLDSLTKSTLRTSGRQRTGESTAHEVEINWGQYFLRQESPKEYTLIARLPEASTSVRQELYRLYRSRKWHPRPWNFGAAPILPRGTVTANRGTFSINPRLAQRVDESLPFFPLSDQPGFTSETRAWLQSVRFPSAKRLAFLPTDHADDTAEAIRNRRPRQGRIWVFCHDQDEFPIPDAEHFAQSGDDKLYEAQADTSELRTWLGWGAVETECARITELVDLILPSAISHTNTGLPVFRTTDVLGISNPDRQPITLVLTHAGRTHRETVQDSLFLLNLDQPGEYLLELESPELQSEFVTFVLTDEPPLEPMAPWRLQLQATHGSVDSQPTRRDFFNGRLRLDISSPRAIQSLAVELSINPGTAREKLYLDRLPVELSANNPVWEKLAKQLPESLLGTPCDLDLTVTVAGVTSTTWRLEADLDEVWWETDESIMRAVSDAGEWEVQACILENGQTVSQDAIPMNTPILFLTVDEDGTPQQFNGYLDVRGTASWPEPPRKPSRLARGLRDQTEASGLLSLTKKYLELACATPSNFVAKLYQSEWVNSLRNWILEICCGEIWIKQWEELNLRESDSAVHTWWIIQHDFDVTLPQLTEGEELPEELPFGFPEQFSLLFPERWWDGQILEMSTDDASRLDNLYKELRDNPNIYTDTQTLNESLQAASQWLCGGPLADLVIPVTGGDELLEWSLTDETVAEVSDGLIAWIGKHLSAGRGRQRWSQEELSDWLNLLLYPEQLRQRPWEELLPKLLTDRPVARAGAFLAWRIEQLERLNWQHTRLVKEH